MGSLENRTIGVIGLGLMGRPMCRNLRRAGARLVVWNRTRKTAGAMAGRGIAVADSPAEVARRARDVILMVADTDAVQQVLFGRNGIAEGLRRGSLVIDMGTTGHARTLMFARWLADTGAKFMDAPVSGGEVGARAGTLAIMAGGTTSSMRRARPLFRALGDNITHVGDVGAGQAAKAANQVIVGLTIGAVAEAFALARGAGVDPAKLRKAIGTGFAASRILELHGQRMVSGDYTPGGRAATQRKDIAQALALAKTMGVDLPASRLNLRLYDRLIAAGDGDLDHSALYRIYD